MTLTKTRAVSLAIGLTCQYVSPCVMISRTSITMAPSFFQLAVETDPNRAPDCDPTQCTLPDCFCSADGTRIPGNIDIQQVPQMITLTFNGAVNVDNIDLYDDIFNGRLNPNGCQIRGTFFVSHKYTNYSAVQDLHRRGHEIGVFSLTHKDDPQYWTQGSYDDWLAEMAGARLIIERFANISDGSIIGMRAPYLRVGGNKQFEMMADQFFVYDASITASLGRVPIWPYTLYFRMPHKCNGNGGNCPSRSHPVWEMVMNELDRRDDPTFDESLPGCHLVDSCSNVQSGEQFGRLLRHNFNRHFNTNRAPLGLNFHASWLKSKKEYKEELIKFIDEMLARNDVYFVTMVQVRYRFFFFFFMLSPLSSWVVLLTSITNRLIISIFRWLSGYRRRQSSQAFATSKTGRRLVTRRASPTVLCQILAPSRLGSFQVKRSDLSLAWNVRTITHGYWTRLETVSALRSK